MTVKQQRIQKSQSNPCAAIGRIIAFALVAFTICALVKTYACGRSGGSCPCHDDSE
jgi:hypothetical protein